MFETATEATPSYLADLNDRQRAAVQHGDGPLLVIAGAGTGKTKTLAARVAHLIERGAAPERILLLTFTRRAAQEMLRRAGRLTGAGRAGRVWGGTFHSVGNRLLRTFGHALGLPPNFTVMDQPDAADLMNLLRNELELGHGRKRFPRKETLAAIYSRTVNSRIRLSEVLEEEYPWCKDEAEGVAAIFTSYTTRKREQAVLDFDDLLLYWHALLVHTDAHDQVAALFDHVLVDEYQDTNGVQADILRAMRSNNTNIMAVGDDAQSIYSFRSATVRNILDFPKHFSGTTVVKLEENYRSTQPILDVSNAVIASARRRYEKELWSRRNGGTTPRLVTCLDEAQQTDEVCKQVLEARERGVTLKEQAVLFRTGHHSAHLEIELTRRNIPFVKFGGLKFVEAAHVKDVVALLRILENPHDELAWFRVLQLIEGVGPATASRIMEHVEVRRSSGSTPERSPLARFMEEPPSIPKPGADEVTALAEAFAACTQEEMAPALQVERLRRWCEPVFVRVYDNSAARVADLVQLERIAAGYHARGRFIGDLALDPPSSTGDLAGAPLLDEDYLNLSTIHSAKGCEWDIVYVIHAADGMMPSDMATGDDEEIEEERRLFYVALTRAKNDLSVYFPLRYYHLRMGTADPHSYAQLTRFISDDVRGLFDERALETAEERTLPATEHAGVQGITDFLADLFEV
ncbi:MAG: ATP-dependent helicase [Actinomycetota bacterium]